MVCPEIDREFFSLVGDNNSDVRAYLTLLGVTLFLFLRTSSCIYCIARNLRLGEALKHVKSDVKSDVAMVNNYFNIRI
jgi:hypothetical protein